MVLNFGVRMGSGVLDRVWPTAKDLRKLLRICHASVWIWNLFGFDSRN